MRLASYLHGDTAGFGAVLADGIVPLASPRCPDLRTALAQDMLPALAAGLTGITARISAEGVTFLPPIPVSDKVLCVGLNYRAHVVETGMAMPGYPSIFVRFAGAQVGHGQDILLPFL